MVLLPLCSDPHSNSHPHSDSHSDSRVGFHEYTFNKKGWANIILDLNHRDKLLEGEVRIINDKTIEILRRSEAWARDQYVYARIEFDNPMKLTNVKANGTKSGMLYSGTELKMSFSKFMKKKSKNLNQSVTFSN